MVVGRDAISQISPASNATTKQLSLKGYDMTTAERTQASRWKQYDQAAAASNAAFDEMMDRFRLYGESHSEDIFVASAVRKYRRLRAETMRRLQECIEYRNGGFTEEDFEDEDLEPLDELPISEAAQKEEVKDSRAPKISEASTGKIERLYLDGVPIHQIAQRTRHTKTQVATVLYARGAMNGDNHKHNAPKTDHATMDAAYAAWKSGTPVAQIRVRYGITKGQFASAITRGRKRDAAND